jgi:hypothetical protein
MTRQYQKKPLFKTRLVLIFISVSFFLFTRKNVKQKNKQATGWNPLRVLRRAVFLLRKNPTRFCSRWSLKGSNLGELLGVLTIVLCLDKSL